MEDKQEPKDIVISQKELVKSIPVEIQDAPKIIIKMPWDDLPEKVKVHDCKLCNSRYREEAELLFEQTANIKKIYKFLNEDRPEDISYAAVRNHLKYHYEGHSSDQLVKEYSTQVDKWLEMQNNQEEGMLRAMAMIEREMTIIEAHAEGMTLDMRRRNADTVVKLGGLLLAYRTKLTEVQQAKQPITFILNQLQIVLKNELDSAGDDTTKQVVKSIMTKLGESCSGMIIEEQ